MLSGITVAASLLLTAPTAPPTTLATMDDKRFELHVGGQGGARFLSGPVAGGGGLHFGLGVRVWRGLYVEVGVAESLHARPAPEPAATDLAFRHLGHADPEPAPEPTMTSDATDASTDADSRGAGLILAGQILMGLRYEIRTPATRHLRPTTFLGVSHLHEAGVDDFLDAPGATLAGFAPQIRHRTGLAAGVGLRAPFPERWGPVAPRFSARLGLDVAYYFDDAPGRLQAGANLGVQVVF
ncbi:MAG: hypothetical protein KC431_03945 [Myxococcales bacterium]|nr:hypothetical protein [Myxococcales bacterium]